MAGVLYHKSRCACGEMFYVPQILQELWLLTLLIFTHLACLLNSTLLHICMWDYMHVQQILLQRLSVLHTLSLWNEHSMVKFAADID